jgi:glyoxylase-like metal-dependent hydrolase (beta-lactamase superfamily II)
MFCFLSVISCFSIYANQFDDVIIKPTQVTDKITLLKGAGGNIGVFESSHGLIMIDDQFEPLAERIEQAMTKISSQPLRYIINTHFHRDHTGSNSVFGIKAPIIAHENVRLRLLTNLKEQNKSSELLPKITFDQSLSFYIDDEKINLTHFKHAHTDGDSVVYFDKANVLHTGDLYFELGFPFIDLKHGGSVKGYLAAVEQLLAQLPNDVKIIPGHGELSNKARYQTYRDMIANSIQHVELQLQAGKSKQQIIADGVPQQYKHWSWQFINEEKWLTTLVDDLSSQ